MKNPLAVFTAAALATLAALAGVNLSTWTPVPPEGQKVPEAQATPAPEAGQEAAKTPEKPAETAALQPSEPPAAESPAAKPAEPPKAETGPGLDTVRVESDGQAIVAGRAQPGAEISLKLGDQVIGKGVANEDGSWVVVPDNPLPKGAHEITVEQKSADSAPVTLPQSIAVAIPEKTGQQAMVALTEPGQATKVLQSGEGEQQASAEPATPEQPAASAEKPAEGQAQNQQMAEAVEQPAGETVAKTEQPSGETVAKTEEPSTTAEQPAETAQPAKAAENVPLRLDAVDYNDKGDIIFSGRAAPGSAIRLYVDNGDVGDAMVDGTGNWSFAGSDIIKPGTHTLRADQIDKSGKVVARIELPFQREDAAAVAALNAPPAEQKTAQVEQPQSSAAKPAGEAEAEPQQASESQPATPTETDQAEGQQPPTQPAEAQQPQAQEPAAQPQATTEVAKTEPQASAPASDEPVAQDKKEEVTTAAAVPADETAKGIEPDKPRSGKVVIQPGNNLWKLSRVIYGRGKSYTVIYKANKDQIRNPNRIYPGQIFAIPNATPPEKIDPKRKEPLTTAEGGAPQ